MTHHPPGWLTSPRCGPNLGHVTSSDRRRTVASLLVVLCVSATAAACGDDEPVAEPTPSPSTTSSPVAPTDPPEEPVTLLSGRDGEDHRVLAIKLDNTVDSTPHAGLIAADVVYLEEVEYGLTRYLAVYSSKYPNRIGPVRSARLSDLELLKQYGRVAFAFSGAQGPILDDIAAAPLFDLSDDAGARGYQRDPSREAPWDLFADPKALLRDAPKATDAHDVGFVFDEQEPDGGQAVRQVSLTYPMAHATFRWSNDEQRWLLWMDGAPAASTEGPQLGGSTLIVQLVDVHPSKYGDSFGGVTPTTKTVGHGKALMFRDGKTWSLTWSRPSPGSPTTWKYEGEPIGFAPGQVWVVLYDEDRSPEVR